MNQLQLGGFLRYRRPEIFMDRLDLTNRSVEGLRSQPSRVKLETELLPAYVTRQRWFASKGDQPEQVRIAQAIALADGRSLLLILDVVTAGATIHYQFPVTLLWDEPPQARDIVAEVQAGTDRGWLVDAYSDDDFVRHLVSSQAADTAVSFRPTAALAPSALAGAVISRPGAEQSNTSIRIGPAILKAYRRLADGVHPEQEIGAFLTEQGFAGVPALLGTLELATKDGVLVLGVMQALVADAVDGWAFVTERLAEIAAGEPGADAHLRRVAELLGTRTAGLHLALAGDPAHPDFAPAPIPDDWVATWADTIAASASAIFPRLERQPGPGRHALPVALHQVKACIKAAAAAASTFSTIRVHGDYHLGQVLVTDGDIFIVDFEGEPMRPLAVRRQTSAALRDVAGMLRSFDYALAVHDAEGSPTSEAAAAVADAKRRFLQSYMAGIAGCAGFPGDLDGANKILMLGLVEKTLYEIGYELDNRPDWVAIPLRGLRDIIGTPEAYRFVP
jgi:trehalose synthase-fused probable maltokinase